MIDWQSAGSALLVMLVLALIGWAVTAPRRNVNLVDSLWSIFFLTGALAYFASLAENEQGPRALFVLALLALWSLRLSLHLARRNWGKLEDHRYQAIRANNSPGFGWKSLYIVFGLQAVLAWLIALPLFAAISSNNLTDYPLGMFDLLGAGLMLFGLVFESIADRQLVRFRANPANRGKVMASGLWHYSRHPNYFGEACVWWGFWLIALASGAAWTVISPLLITFLLLRVSGVAMMEKNMADRRPAYRDYIARTSAFVPWPKRQTESREAA